ncbi:carboxypeptidase-like regulatory domain-containing protein [Lutibacter sp. HS1-25]|nr:carboxypeptidase-like regulatory domain-containing protein [Lutibacter sp. HS1-25]
MKKHLYFLFICFLSICLKAQTVNLKGVVKDSLQNYLAYANVIAKPKDSSKALKFSITDDIGYYKLELLKNNLYTISVSYLGFKTESFQFVAHENSQKNIVLSVAPNQLQEVVIELPVIYKEDTITFNTDHFITGDERKLKNVLNKLPGVEVQKNGDVTVQGKKITKLLVEGRTFFDGGTKMAVDNIPADAIDKVQVIDNYSEIAFLKNVSSSNEMAMNIMLKKDKKEFVFGDVEVGKGANDFYRMHSNLFYYSPKTTANFIGNLNNTGEKTFSVKDYMNFKGGVSAILNDNGSIYNESDIELSQFLETQDVVESSNKFGALNIYRTINNKLTISGFGIFSHVKNKSIEESLNQYPTFTEATENIRNNRNQIALGNFRVEYAPSTHEQWYFKTSVKRGDNFYNEIFKSFIVDNDLSIETNFKNPFFFVNQTFELHKKLSRQHSFSLALSTEFNNKKPTFIWETNKQLLKGLIPFTETANYLFNQFNEITNANFSTVFKHYWVINNTNHIYTTVGNKFNKVIYKTEENQVLDDGTTVDFSEAGFGNNLNYQLNDLYLGIQYKRKLGIFEIKPGLFLHNYNWNLVQLPVVSKHKLIVLPEFFSKIEFSNSNKLQFNYQLKSFFSDASKFANRYYLSSYNTVFKGNEHLENELMHSARLYYSRFSLYKGLMLFSILNYTKKVKGIQNTVQFEGVNQFITPIIINNPEERYSFNLNVTKKIKDIKYGISTNAATSKFLQNINTVTVTNQSNSIGYKVLAKTLFDKFPTVEFGFEQNFGSYISSDLNSRFVTNRPYLNIDYDFLEGFIFSFEFENYRYENTMLNQKNKYQILNSTLSYRNENSVWSFKFEAKNLFNANFKQFNSFSTYIISDSKTYILPRILLFTIGYNL